jgi:hypothetical protein
MTAYWVSRGRLGSDEISSDLAQMLHSTRMTSVSAGDDNNILAPDQLKSNTSGYLQRWPVLVFVAGTVADALSRESHCRPFRAIRLRECKRAFCGSPPVQDSESAHL